MRGTYAAQRFLIQRGLRLPICQGFTLVEALVVLGLIAIISAMLFPVMQTSKDTAQLAVCTMNMKQIYNGLVTQSLKTGSGLLPPNPQTWEVYAEALVESKVMICPMETDGNHFKVDSLFEFLPEPPPDLLQGTMESDDKVMVFREQAAMTLDKPLDIISKTGQYGRGAKNPSFCNYNVDSKLMPGTLIDVYYFSWDPITEENTGGKDGEIWFGTNDFVKGVSATRGQLNNADKIVGIPGYEYPSGLGCRGMDPCTTGKWADSFELTDHRRSVIHQFSHASTKCKDDFRVYTTPGSGTSYAMNMEVSRHPGNEKQILLTDSKVPWIDFRGGTDDNDFTFEESVDARHFGKANALTVDGAVELFDPMSIQPNSVFWRR